MSAPGGGFNLATVYVQVLPSMRGFGPALAGPAGQAGSAAGSSSGGKFSSAFKGAIKGVGAIVAGTLAAGAGIATLGLKSAAALETSTASFTSLLGSTKAATDQIAELQKYAAATPFEQQDVLGFAQQYFTLAKSVGLSKDQLTPFLDAVGNLGAVTGASVPDIQNAVRAIGQIGSSGKVSLDNLNQISEAFPGFNGAAAIASATGMTTAETLKAISAGSISADVGVNALLIGMQKFPGAAGAMTKQAQTLNGVLSTFGDTVKIELTKAFTPLIPVVKNTLNTLLPTIKTVLSQVAPVIASFVKQLAPVLGPLLKGLGTVLIAVFKALGPLLSALTPVIQPLANAFAAMARAVTPLIVLFGQIVAQLGPPIIQIFTNLAQTLTPVIQQLAASLAPVLPIIATALKQVMTALQPVIAALANGFLSVITAIAPSLPGLATALGQLAVAAAQLIVPLTPLITLFARFAGFAGKVLIGAITVLARALTFLIKPWTVLFAVIRKLIEKAIGPVKTAFAAVVTAVSRVANYLKPLISLFGSVTSAVGKAASAVGKFFNGGGTGNVSPYLHSVLSGTVQGLYAVENGARQAGGAAQAAFQAVANGASAAANAAFAVAAGVAATANAVGSLIASGARRGAASAAPSFHVPNFSIPNVGGGSSGGGRSGPAPRATPAPPPAFERSTLLTFLQGATGAQTNPLDSALSAILASARAAKKTIGLSLTKKLVVENARLKRLVAERASLAVRLQAAQQKLIGLRQQLADKASSVKSATVGSFDIASSGTGFDGNQPVTFNNILAQIKQTVARATKFTATLKKLRKDGLSKYLVAQLAEAGPQALPQALALASATPKQLAQVNSQYSKLNAQGSSLGSFIAKDLYQTGVDSAVGIVRGLESRQSVVVSAIKRLGLAMVAQLKKTLKIKSPSKVMHGLGAFTGEGFRSGIASKYGDVKKAGDKLGRSAMPSGSAGDVNAARTPGGGGFVTRDELAALMRAWENKPTVLVARERELARAAANGAKQLGRLT